MDIRKINAEETWDLRHKVMWPDKDIEYVKLEKDNEGLHFGLFIGEKMVSVVSVFIKGDSCQFRKFATLKQEQGKGYGTYLLTEILKEIDSQKIKRVWCNARVSKVGFYKRLGLYETNEKFEKDGEMYIIMEKRYDH